ncbi:hypothetical protein [Shewanella xiamenensis]|uniref:hypothetical protein n=1 Tax=Shewanella xiamenensis TaxID=332186 RepID=UPI002E7B4271|nr:hypothetical protein [Shewanella xiamenensis]
MTLKKNLLDIEWLLAAKMDGWLQTKMQDVIVSADLASVADATTVAVCDTVSAAHALIDDSDQAQDAFETAIKNDNIELTIVLLALTELTAYHFENNILAMAVAYQRKAIFNLLLLHPDIEVNCDFMLDNEHAEIAASVGHYDSNHYFSPHLWLLDPLYERFYPFLNIDWQFRFGYNAMPILAHCYQKRDFATMDRLVGLGAEINPALDEWDDRERLFHLALRDWRDDDPETQLGLRWFARYISFLNDPSFDCDVLTDVLQTDMPAVHALFEIQAISFLKQAIEEKDEKIAELERIQVSREEVIHSSGAYFARNTRQPSSLTDDLLRLKLVELTDDIEDIQFCVTDEGIEFGIRYLNRSFGRSIFLPASIIEKMPFAPQCSIQSMTQFQCQAWLLMSPPELYLWLNILAQDNGAAIFKAVKDHPICNRERQVRMSAILAAGGIDGEFLLVDKLQRELERYEDLLSMLNDMGLLVAPFTAEERNELQEWRFDGRRKAPKLAVEMLIAEETSPRVSVCAELEGQWHNIGSRFFDEDWAQILFDTPNFIPCESCGETFYRHLLAYEQECMECINR